MPSNCVEMRKNTETCVWAFFPYNTLESSVLGNCRMIFFFQIFHSAVCGETHLITQSIGNWALDFSKQSTSSRNPLPWVPTLKDLRWCFLWMLFLLCCSVSVFSCNLRIPGRGTGRIAKSFNSSPPNGEAGLGNQHSSAQLETSKVSEMLPRDFQAQCNQTEQNCG